MIAMRKAATEKILVLGVDGFDPRLASKYLAQGKLPNIQKYIERGSCREDLVMLGGHPTVTPSMWTTLATGCYANVHGITGFYRKAEGKNLDYVDYNLDSRNCKAEPLWNIFAESGKKTLVWHWPGSSWPPTSDNENLYVVDGSSPGSVGMAVATVDEELLCVATNEITKIVYAPKAAAEGVTACVIKDLDLEENAGARVGDSTSKQAIRLLILHESQKTHMMTENPLDVAQSTLKDATDWANAPADAKEFVVQYSGGLVRRPALILKNENGKYDKVALYKSKKETEPLCVLEINKMVKNVVDDAFKGDNKYSASRNMKVLELAEDGSKIVLWVSPAMDIHNDSVFHPRRIYKDIVENIGYVPPSSLVGCQDSRLITGCMLDNWSGNAEWQADAIKYLIEKEGIEIVFSHFHNVDLQMHMFAKHLYDKGENRLPLEAYYKFTEDVYVQTDNYLGNFIHLLDEGWTIAITSDHGIISGAHPNPFIGESPINVRVMQELGLTVLKTDENGNELEDIDWTKTKAIAQRETHIYVNLKGRDPEGIVEPEDKYAVEEEIMTKLYGYRDKVTGQRIISLAVRNKDAVHFGLGGPDSGDIVYFVAEGYNFDHSDSLSTFTGEGDTSVSPIFIMAGPGIKENFKTDRIIREIDFAPTVAVLGGVRMPAQCEGAPVYQILTEEY